MIVLFSFSLKPPSFSLKPSMKLSKRFNSMKERSRELIILTKDDAKKNNVFQFTKEFSSIENQHLLE